MNPFVTSGYVGAEYFFDRGVYSVYDKFLELWLKREHSAIAE